MPHDVESALAPEAVEVAGEGGLRLNVWDYGGSGTPLLLCHCTGALARVWDPVVTHLHGRFRILAPDTRGHGDSQAVESKETCAWSRSGSDLLAIIEAFDLGPGVYAAGHSAGAAHIAYAEDQAPGTFAKTAWLDAIIGPRFVFEGPNPLAESARRRRNILESRESAAERFAAKPPKNTWVRAALEAYLAHGLRDLDDGRVELKLHGDTEAWFYEMGGACELFERLETIQTPVRLITGSTSYVAPIVEAQAEKLPHAERCTIEGASHFIPQEYPAAVAAHFVEWFD